MYWEFSEFRFQAAIQFPTQKQNKIVKLEFIVLCNLDNIRIHSYQFPADLGMDKGHTVQMGDPCFFDKYTLF
jgi:hypothetical protein